MLTDARPVVGPSSPSAPGVASDRRYTNLEIVRILAAALVIFFHLQQRFALELGLMQGFNTALGTLGSIGVDLFFVISGFVMALNVFRGDRAGRFAVARASRILPSYWLLTAVAALTTIALPGQFAQPFSLGRFISSLFFVDVEAGYPEPLISMGWTLDLEIRFYLIVTLCLFLLPRAAPRYLVLVLVVSGLVAYVELAHQDHIMYEFGLGFAAFGFMKLVEPGRLVGCALIVVGVLGVAAWQVGLTGAQDRWLAFGVPALLIVLGVLLLPQARHPFLKRLGFASYGTYLLQWFTIPVTVALVAALHVGGELAPVMFTISLVACVAAGVLYSLLVDERLYALARRLLTPRLSRVTPASGARTPPGPPRATT
ncbi:MAG: acyltransferase [Actinomycetota bacterium]